MTSKKRKYLERSQEVQSSLVPDPKKRTENLQSRRQKRLRKSVPLIKSKTRKLTSYLSDGMDMRFRSNRHIMLTRSKAIKMKDHSYKNNTDKRSSLNASTVSKVHFENCNLIYEASENVSSLEEKHFSLEELAHHLDVNISKYMANKEGNSNKAAAKIVGTILDKVYKKMALFLMAKMPVK